TAGQVGTPGHGAVHLLLEHTHPGVVAALHGGIDGSGGQVQGAHRVPAQHARLGCGHVVLEVVRTEGDLPEHSVAAAVQEQLRLAEVFLLAGVAGQFHQGDLDLRVAADRLPPGGAEGLAHVVRGAQGDLHQGVVSVGASAGHGRLDEVPVAV